MTPQDNTPPGSADRTRSSQQIQRWRRWGWISRFLLVCVIGLGVVFGAGVWALHQVLVPRIQEYKPKLEARASAMIGVPVRIAEVVAKTGGWIPSFELHKVELLGPDGRTALSLPRVVAAVSARSIWWFGFEQIYIDAPELDVRRDAQGRLVIAGLVLGAQSQSGDDAADWFFSQPEVVIRHGTLNWTDEKQEMPAIRLTEVDLVVRNPGLRHQIRLDATPPVEWGDRFTLQADMRHALWETREGEWRKWSGTAHAGFTRVDVAALRKYTQLGVSVREGKGALRVWAELRKGLVEGVTADVALERVSATLSKELPPLELDTLTGRLNGRHDDQGTEFHTEGLQFLTRDGVRWPGGNVRMSQKRTAILGRDQGEFHANQLDVATLAQMANRLPLGDGVHRWLSQLAPKGRVQTLDARWEGEWRAPASWSVNGVMSDIDILSQAQTGASAAEPGRPGIRGAQVELEANQSGGRAQLKVREGAVVFPGVFEEPSIPLEEFEASVRWSSKGQWPDVDLDVQVDRVRFANADAQGSGSAKWRSADVKSAGGSRYPGVLELDMNLARADGARVHRYLPLVIPKTTRDYVRDAVSRGRSDDVKVRVRGDLQHFPFSQGQGEFRIQAQIKDATYAYVPHKTAGTWPALQGLSGQLVFDRASMEVKGATALVAGTQRLQTTGVQATIANLDQPVVAIQGDLQGPLSEMLDVMRQSPLQGLTQGVLAGSTGQGDAQTRLQLDIPLGRIENTRVQGTVTLAGNDIRITPDTPTLYKAKGTIGFADTGFQIVGGQARFLGGDVRIEGGTLKRAAGAPGASNDQTILIKAQGQVSAQGLREAREFGMLSQLAKGATGSTSYVASLGFRRGKPEVSVSTNLQGMALQLPQPMLKAAESVMPVRYEQALRKDSLAAGQSLQDGISVDIGRLINVDLVRDVSAATPRVLRGTMGVGQVADQELPMPSEGVVANVAFDAIDLDAWEQVLQSQSSGSAAGVSGYWPSSIAMHTRVLTLGGRQFNRVVVGATREGANWRANLTADELDGYIEYRVGQGNAPGAVFARLARVTLGAAAASDIESVLDQQPASIPALDVVVEDMEYKGRKLGRVDLEAVNQGRVGSREWRLRKFNITLPEASFQASGNWARIGEMAATGAASGAAAPVTSVARGRGAPRRTAMKFKLDIQDSGALLKRFGMGDLVRKAPGVMEGQISWVGSPFALDYPTMQGQFNIDIKEGQFLKVEPGAARLLGVLSLQSLPRRLILDFRDVFSDGFAFDQIRGDVNIEAGIAKTNNIQMKGVVAGVLMEGTANIARETQDLHVVVVPEINAGTASLFAAAVNPVVGLGTFLAQAILRRPLIRSNTEEFRVEGSWSDPRVTKLSRKDEPAEPARKEESK